MNKDAQKDTYTSTEETLVGRLDMLLSDTRYKGKITEIEEIKQEIEYINERIDSLKVATEGLEKDFEKMKKGIAVQPKARERFMRQEKGILDQLEHLLRTRKHSEDKLEQKRREIQDFEEMRANIIARIAEHLKDTLNSYGKQASALHEAHAQLNEEVSEYKKYGEQFKEQAARTAETLEKIKNKPPEERALYEWKMDILEKQIGEIERLLGEYGENTSRLEKLEGDLQQNINLMKNKMNYWTNILDIFKKEEEDM